MVKGGGGRRKGREEWGKGFVVSSHCTSMLSSKNMAWDDRSRWSNKNSLPASGACTVIYDQPEGNKQTFLTLEGMLLTMKA